MPLPTMFKRTPSPPIVKIPGHFGDIMAKRQATPPPPFFAYLPAVCLYSTTTTTRNTSLSLPDGFTGFERILLTANGNLQRLISAYFNEVVTVTIVENKEIPLHPNEDPQVLARFQREVNLLCNNKIFCNAKSQVLIKDQKVYDLVVKDGVGIGQIFRYLDKLPSFDLHGLGRTEKTFWREYSLKIPGVDCRLLEVFPSTLSEDGWLHAPDEEVCWDVEMEQDDNIAWVNPDLEVK
ncbi:hypothetical protein BGZ96_003514 [Linnemannia gamsii]|uniref:Uncharacterized protein n=1 Tax=Linnemannia gamsii TaxID=64522 RepID=A0ABQ7JJ41_9FUNG|nr:hypothetical protein BGZ96_003514 [Linnemannia gamsii]